MVIPESGKTLAYWFSWHIPDKDCKFGPNSRCMALQDKYINPFTDYGFKKLFGTEIEAAEIARFYPKEKAKYEESLKYYRDLKNVVDTSFEEGKAEGPRPASFRKTGRSGALLLTLALPGIFLKNQ